ncbi:Outer membrane assembly protein [Chitinispirillum alkaliphilum]|nr:Outer membrane assembly protein [Chitinispirillum alkaliphilum]
MKKVLKVLLILVVLFALLFTAGAVTLYVMFPPEQVKQLAVTHLEYALGREIEVGSVSFRFFPALGVSLSDVEVSETKRESFGSERPFISFDRFLISISVRSIFKGYPEVTSVVLQNPEITIEVDEDGAFNYDDLKILQAAGDSDVSDREQAVMALPVPITLRSLRIRDGMIRYIDQKEQSIVTIGKLEKNLGLAINKSLSEVNSSGSLILDRISVETKEVSTPLSDLSFTFDHDLSVDLLQGAVKINKAEISLQKLQFDITGTITEFFDTPVLDLVVNSSPFDIEDIISEIPAELFPEKEKLTASGTAKLDLVISGILEDESLPIKGTLVFSDGRIGYTDLPQDVSGINSIIEFTDNSLDLKETSFNFGSSPIELGAKVQNFEQPFIDGFLRGVINLSDVQEMIEVPPGASVSGRVNADIRAKGEADPQDPSKLDLGGKVELDNLVISWPPLAKPAEIQGVFTLSSRAIGEKMTVNIGQSSLSMEATITDYLSLLIPEKEKELPRPKIDFALTSPLLNIDEILIEEKGDPSQQSGNETAPFIAPLPGVDMQGTVRARKVVFNGLDMDNLNVGVDVRNDVADVNITTLFSGGRINNVLNADLRNVENVSFNNRLDVSGVEVNQLFSGFGDFIPPTTALNRELRNLQNSLFGKINISSRLSGRGANPDEIVESLNGNINFELSNGYISNALILDRVADIVKNFIEIENLTFRQFNAQMQVSKGNLIIDDMNILSTAGDWRASGRVGFNNQLDLNISNRLPSGISQSILSVQSRGRDALSGLLSGTALDGASGLLDEVGIPSDRDGRVTLLLNVGGTLDDPGVTFTGFAPGEASRAPARRSVQESVTERVQENVEQHREQIESRVREERNRIEEQIEERVRDKSSDLEEQRREVEGEVRRGLDRLKRRF